MPPVVSALLAFVVSLFRSQTSLRLEHLALRHQLAVYQQTIPRPRLSPIDRLVWVWLSRLWSGWQAALAFVQPRTVIAWQRRQFHDHWRRLSQRGTSGRPAVPREIRDLIRDMSQANPLWGSPRIVGELHKLGIKVAKSTLEKYRVRLRKPPSPTWKAFLNNHVNDLVALDFFVVPTFASKVLFVLVILAHERRGIVHVNEAIRSDPQLDRLVAKPPRHFVMHLWKRAPLSIRPRGKRVPSPAHPWPFHETALHRHRPCHLGIGVTAGHRELAVAYLAQRARLLSGDAHRSGALPGKAGIVNDRHGIAQRRLGEHLLHALSVEVFLVSLHVREELLQPLLTGSGNPLRHGVAVFIGQFGEQPRRLALECCPTFLPPKADLGRPKKLV